MKPDASGYGAGWVARFEDESALATAAAAVREAGFLRWDVYSPYPCDASRFVPFGVWPRRKAALSRWGTIGGLAGGLLVAAWLGATQLIWADPLINQGRGPGLGLWFGYVPFVLEGMLLGAGLALSAGFLYQAGLPRWFEWVFAHEGLSNDATTRAFFLVADSSCGEAVCDLLARLGASSVDWVEARPGEGGRDG